MKKTKFKVGDRVKLTKEALSMFFPGGTKFQQGIVEELESAPTMEVCQIKVQRDNDGILYRGHESKWWYVEWWEKK